MSISASQVEPRKQLEKLKSGRRRTGRRGGGVGGAEWGMGGRGGRGGNHGRIRQM